MKRRFAIALSVACSALGAIARADDVEPIALAYDAPDGCPSSDAFFREVTARTSRARAAAPQEKARVMHVVVTRRADGHAGRLWMEDASGIGSAREVSSKSCGEVVGALALIGALAVDPQASVAPRPLPVVAPVPPPTGAGGAGGSGTAASGAGGTAGTAASGAGGTGATGSGASGSAGGGNPGNVRSPAGPVAANTAGAAPAGTGQAPPEKPVVTEETPKKTDVRDRPVPKSPAPASAHGPIEIGAQIEVAFLADAVAAGRIFADIETGSPDRTFAPSLRLALARSLDTDRAVSGAAATLRWTEGSFEACPFRFALARPLAIRPCAGVAAGVLQAAGTGVLAAESRSRPWAAVSLDARLAWEPVRWLAIEVEAGAIAPLYRESFFFEPGVTVYEAPTVAFLSRAGIGVRFP